MFHASETVTYMAVVLALFLVPGPAVLLTLARAISGGRRTGVATGLGIATGDIVHTTAAAIGLSALLMTSSLAFEAVRYLGVAYLIYLGIRSLLEPPADVNSQKRSIAPARAYREAVLAEILNPKTSLFFLAFLPQFVHPERGSAVLQLILLGAIFVAMSAIYTSALALSAGWITRWLRAHPRFVRWQGRVIGAVYITLGIRLVFQER